MPTAPARESGGPTAHSPVVEFASSSTGGAVGDTAVLRRSKATAVRLRKATPASSAAHLTQGHQTARSPAPAFVHPLSDATNGPTGSPPTAADSKITIICEVRLSTKPGTIDSRFGKSIADWPSSELIPDVANKIVKNQFNATWLNSYKVSLDTQTDVAVRLRDNVPLVNGTANLSVGDFYKYYEKHPTGTCAVDTAKKSHKSAVLGKRVIMLELYIDMEQFKQRTEQHFGDRSIAKSKSGVARSMSTYRSQTAKRGQARSMSAANPTGRQGTTSLARRVPSSAAPNAARSSQRSTSSSKTARSASTSGYQVIRFRRLISRMRESASGTLLGGVIVDNDDEPDSAWLTAEVRRSELTRGSMKQVYEATYRDKPFVAKRYYRLDTTARTRRAVSTEANNDALRDEIICYGKATFWLGAFMDAAQSARVDIDACIEITDAFIAEEEDGTAWLFEPRRTSASPVKFSGTMRHDLPAHRQTDKTVQAFVHFAFAQSSGSVVFADVQGSTGRLSTGQDGTVLFDLMMHTSEGESGLGDHGSFGIQLWKEQHNCNEICKALEDAELFERPDSPETPDYNTSSVQEPPHKRRKIKSSGSYEDEEIVILDGPKGYRESRSNPATDPAMRRPTPPNFDDHDLPDLFTGPSPSVLARQLSDADGTALSAPASEGDD